MSQLAGQAWWRQDLSIDSSQSLLNSENTLIYHNYKDSPLPCDALRVTAPWASSTTWSKNSKACGCGSVPTSQSRTYRPSGGYRIRIFIACLDKRTPPFGDKHLIEIISSMPYRHPVKPTNSATQIHKKNGRNSTLFEMVGKQMYEICDKR